MLAVQCAQRNLCRKLGLSADKLVPFKQVLCEFIDLFILRPTAGSDRCSMGAILDLNGENPDLLYEALLQHPRTTVANLAPITMRLDAANIFREERWSLRNIHMECR
jgi:hypothetical protein